MCSKERDTERERESICLSVCLSIYTYTHADKNSTEVEIFFPLNIYKAKTCQVATYILKKNANCVIECYVSIAQK